MKRIRLTLGYTIYGAAAILPEWMGKRVDRVARLVLP